MLRSLYVLPDHRGCGAGDLLVTEFLDWARDRSCAEAHVDHYALNESAQRLYERRGSAVRSVSCALDLCDPQAGGRDCVASSHQDMPEAICSRVTPPA